MSRPRPALDGLLGQFESRCSAGRKFVIEGAAITAWDSSLVAPLYMLLRAAERHGFDLDFSGLPDGTRRLLQLALAGPVRAAAARGGEDRGWLALIGRTSADFAAGLERFVPFLGETVLAAARWAAGRARVPYADLIEILLRSGPAALPIIALISVLVGLILAYIGAVQLRQFGAELYVANLVGIGMAREMGAVMTAVLMAGRTGAAFAAQLGTMRVNEEIEALQTTGIAPVEFLVLPRVAALVAMMPPLCLYADIGGIAGGMLVSIFTFDVTMVQYLEQTRGAIALNDLWVGLAKSLLFGILVGLCGCYYGLRCPRNATAVGEAATSAVVISIVSIVIADALFAVLTDVLGI